MVSTFANPNILAGYMLMVLPLAWASCVSAAGLRRAAWLLAAVLLGGLLLLTFSKASWLLCFTLIGLWALARLPIGATFALGAAGGIVAGVILLLIEPVIRTLCFSSRTAARSASTRGWGCGGRRSRPSSSGRSSGSA